MAEAALVSGRLVLSRRSTGAPLALDPALEIGVGGEARVLGVPGDESLVAKLYHQPTLERAHKLARMIEAPPVLEGGAALAWPVDLLTGPGGGRFAGFLMPRAEGPRIFEFYNPVSRRRAAPLFDWGRMHRAGTSLAAAFDALHGRGYVVGDVNESNILVSPEDASVTLVDADSFQVRDALTGAVHRSGVGKAEFTPPELQGARFADVDRAPEHDRFGLAVLLFLLLMEGTHPFAMRFEGDGEALPVEERIRRGLYPNALPDDDCRPPRLAPPIQTLQPGLQALFVRCFVQGHADPAARPTAAEWRDALAVAEGELRVCDENPRHLFGGHVPFCPWCHRARLLQGRDPFPVSLELARAADLKPRAAARAVPRTRARARRSSPAPAPKPPAPIPAPTPRAPTPPTVPAGLLPQWLVGPTALGNPVSWFLVALFSFFPFVPNGARLLILGLGLVSVLVPFLKARRAGLAIPPYRITVLTGVWVWVLPMLLLPIVIGIAEGLSATADANVNVQAVGVPVAPSADAPAPPRVIQGLPVYELSEVDVQPELVNRDVVDATLSRYRPASFDYDDFGTVTVAFTVDTLGVPVPGSAWVESTPREGFSAVAVSVVARMRFRPAEKDGRPVPVRVTLPLTFALP